MTDTCYYDDALALVGPGPLSESEKELVKDVEFRVVWVELAHEDEHDLERHTHQQAFLVAVSG